MKPYLLVLIAAVTVNCLVTAINVETSSEALTVPYIDTLLPPFEDKADSNGEASPAAKAKINVKAKVTPGLKTTKSKTTAKTTTTTKKPIINDVNNNLAAPSIEALLPPLFEAKTEEAVTTTTKRTTTTRATTTTRRPTTTTRRPTTKRTTTTTRRPITTTTTTLKPTKGSKVQVPDLLLNPLLPPLVDNEIVSKDEVSAATTTTQKSLIKTTKKSYYQQQQQQQLKHLPVDNKKDLKNFHTLKSGLKTNDKHVAETKIQTKQVTSLPSNIESVTRQHVAKQTTASQEKRVSNSPANYNSKQQNYNYDLYFGSTTPRPVKNGLPTITPFPHRLGR